jgi:hypothetical protein
MGTGIVFAARLGDASDSVSTIIFCLVRLKH